MSLKDFKIAKDMIRLTILKDDSGCCVKDELEEGKGNNDL